MITIKQYKPQDEILLCKLRDIANLKIKGDFFSLTKAYSEISLICLEKDAPENALFIQRGYTAIYFTGEEEDSYSDILAQVTGALTENDLEFLIVSTYLTDYIIVKKETIDRVFASLGQAGCEISAD